MKKAFVLAALGAFGVANAGCSSTVTVGTGCVDDLDCLADEFCDVDGFCTAVGGCIDDTDCLADEFCDVDGVCVVDDTYQSCVDTLDCSDPIDQCWEVDLPDEGTFGNYCSNECGADADCQPANGYGGVCYAVEVDPTFLCYQQCEFDEDCYIGSVCVEVFLDAGLVDFICAPDN